MNSLKEKAINEIFSNSKHINLEIMKYALELCDEEDKKRKKYEEKLKK